jgi:hypothetical protein
MIAGRGLQTAAVLGGGLCAISVGAAHAADNTARQGVCGALAINDDSRFDIRGGGLRTEALRYVVVYL